MANRCPTCGTDNSDKARICSRCSTHLRRNRRAQDEPPPRPENALAMTAWRCALYGLIPPLGVLLGPAGFFLGALAYRRNQADTVVSGNGHALGSMFLGGLTLLTNWAGLALILYGLGTFGQ